MKRRQWLLSLIGFLENQLPADDRTVPADNPVCPFAHQDSTRLPEEPIVATHKGTINHVNQYYCNVCGCVFVTIGTPDGA